MRDEYNNLNNNNNEEINTTQGDNFIMNDVQETPVNQPINQEPVYEAPVQQSSNQEPVYEAPAYQPGNQEPVYEAPAYQPGNQEPVYEAPTFQSGNQEPVYEAPAYQSGNQEPVYEAPAYQSGNQEPVYEAPTYQSGNQEPVYEASTYQSGNQEPVYDGSVDQIIMDEQRTQNNQVENDVDQSQQFKQISPEVIHMNTDYEQESARKAATYEFVPKEPKKNKKPSSGKKFAKFIAGAAVFGLVAGTVFQGVNYGAGMLLGNNGSGNTATLSTTMTSATAVSSESPGVSQIAKNAMPSIVAITSTVEQTTYDFFNQPSNQEQEGSGSGIIIGKNGSELLIATNNHVVEGATKLQVSFIDNEVVDATIKGTDPDSDLAVVTVPVSSLKSSTLEEIKVAVMGDSESLEAGQQVVAIGNALGYGQSVTGGYISALNREIQLEDKTMTLLQTDAAINPGNSGGALLNMNGEVIGINSAKAAANNVEGMGYAIPISKASPIIEELMNETSIPADKQAFLGISGFSITDEYTNRFNMPNGVYVSQVTEGSPAAKAGIRANDIITGFGSRDVLSMESLQGYIAKHAAGDKVKVTVQRQNQNGQYEKTELEVTLQAKSALQ